MPELLPERLLVDQDGDLIVCDEEFVRTEQSECACGPLVHLWFYWCPCGQDGCWNDHVSWYIRDDVRTNAGELVSSCSGVIRIGGEGGWCYHRLGLPVEEGQIPDGAFRITPEDGPPSIECVPPCDGGSESTCDCPECIPPTGGDCPCRCEGACFDFRRQISPGCWEICCHPRFTAPPQRPNYHFETVQYEQTETLSGGGWCHPQGCTNYIAQGGCILERHTRTLGALIGWSECDACWEVWDVKEQRHPGPCTGDSSPGYCSFPLVAEAPQLMLQQFCISQVRQSIVEGEFDFYLYGPEPGYCGCGDNLNFGHRTLFYRNPVCFELERGIIDTVSSTACAPNGLDCGCRQIQRFEEYEGWSWSPPADPNGCCRGCNEDVCDDPEVNDGGGCTHLPLSPLQGAGSLVL